MDISHLPDVVVSDCVVVAAAGGSGGGIGPVCGGKATGGGSSLK